jgi:DNA-binding beta-propeller fold protein YncE
MRPAAASARNHRPSRRIRDRPATGLGVQNGKWPGARGKRSFPFAIAITQDGRSAYVAAGDADVVTPIAVGAGRAGAPIRVGYSPAAVTVSPSGATAYVVNTISGTVTPVAAGTGVPGAAIPGGLRRRSRWGITR